MPAQHDTNEPQTQHMTVEDKMRAEFEQWYAENAFDYVSNPIGSRECGLQWKAWQSCAAQSAETIAAKDAEIAHWKANHDTQVKAARALKERGEIPLERIRYYDELVAQQETIARLEAIIDAMYKCFKDVPTMDETGFDTPPEFRELLLQIAVSVNRKEPK